MNHTHLPAWLENNPLFRKLFLLRKLFLTSRRKTHYGQCAEDIAIAQFFRKQDKGTYVDVGCFHPVKYNNTYRLYKKGWHGVNIDIDPIKIEGFNMLRKRDTNIAIAISDHVGTVTYWTNGFYSPTVTLDRQFAENANRNKSDYRPRKVRSAPLTDVLDQTPLRGKPVDLLTIDVEGHDYHVLHSLDFTVYQPRCIAVETQLRTLEAVMEAETYVFLFKKGYTLVNWVGMTLIFMLKNSELMQKMRP